jgi:hypothetical protein
MIRIASVQAGVDAFGRRAYITYCNRPFAVRYFHRRLAFGLLRDSGSVGIPMSRNINHNSRNFGRRKAQICADRLEYCDEILLPSVHITVTLWKKIV